jgi:hypothetical protein
VRRLAGRFAPEELRAMSPEARAKWLALVRSHALAARRDTEALRSELRPVFFQGTTPDESAVRSDITGGAELPRVAGRLFALAAANYEALRSAFSASGGTVAAAPPVNTARLWGSLKEAEAAAAEIQLAAGK